MADNEGIPSMIGQTLGHYRIVEKIGAGGNWVKTSDDAGTWQKIEQKNQGLLGHFRRFVSRLRRFVISREASA